MAQRPGCLAQRGCPGPDRPSASISPMGFSASGGVSGQVDVDAVAQHMTLASGYIWSMPIVFDLSQETWTGWESSQVTRCC